MYIRTLRFSQDLVYLLRSLYLTLSDTRLGEIPPKCWEVSNLLPTYVTVVIVVPIVIIVTVVTVMTVVTVV